MKYRANARCEIRLRRMKYALHIINHQVYDRNKICPPGIAETKVSGDVYANVTKCACVFLAKCGINSM